MNVLLTNPYLETLRQESKLPQIFIRKLNKPLQLILEGFIIMKMPGEKLLVCVCVCVCVCDVKRLLPCNRANV